MAKLDLCMLFIQLIGQKNRCEMSEEKSRVIQEYVPGKQVTMAHLIASPVKELYKKLGMQLENQNALGILTITPSEAAIVAADIGTKSANVEIGFVDRFSGSLMLSGSVSDVESAINAILTLLSEKMHFTVTEMTRS